MSVNNNVGSDYNLTPRVKKALTDAKKYADDSGHTFYNVAHVLYGCLLNAPDGFWAHLGNYQVDLSKEAVLHIIESYAEESPELFFSLHETKWHPSVRLCIDKAQEYKEENEQYYIGVEHLLAAILETSDDLRDYLNGADIDPFFLNDIILETLTDGYSLGEEDGPAGIMGDIQGAVDATKLQEVLHKYATSLNYLYFQDQLPEIYGREKEMQELVEILSKKTKSNAIIIGESGVGKTALVEGLVRRITDVADIPCTLMGHEVFLVDLGAMVAGTRYRGEFEEKFNSLIKAAEQLPNCILFFDEIHNLFGAGNSDGALDASNMLKPALVRGNLKCIGATTSKEYQKIFEKDGAMKRRFETLVLDEPPVEEVKKMMKVCAVKYAGYHNVSYSNAIINLIVDLCQRYLPNRRFPDKAFDVIDQVGAKVKVSHSKLPQEIIDKHASINAFLSAEQEEGEEPPTLDSGKGHALLGDYMESLREFYANLEDKPTRVKVTDVVEVVAEKAGISVTAINNTRGGFPSFLKNMKSVVFGQDSQLEEVNDILACAKVGLNEENKPLCNLLFLGETSVGKTYTAKNIAQFFFDNPKAFLQINMSEYQDKGSISKLIGTSAGFVGYEDGGLITDFVSKNPNSVVLFDEIEKAHPKVLDILLHILDEGYVNDNLNRRIDFSNTIVILTSNLGHAEFAQRSVGFIPSKETPDTSYKETVKKKLRPELIARLNEILVFNSLTDREFRLIIARELNEIKERLKKRGITFSFPAGAVETILKKANEDKLHARNIKELVRREVQVPVAKKVVDSPKIKKISLDKSIKIT